MRLRGANEGGDERTATLDRFVEEELRPMFRRMREEDVAIDERVLGWMSAMESFVPEAERSPSLSGRRLVAYVAMLEEPRRQGWFVTLALMVGQFEKVPFNQWWGLRAIKAMIDHASPADYKRAHYELSQLLERIPEDSARMKLLRTVLSRLEASDSNQED